MAYFTDTREREEALEKIRTLINRLNDVDKFIETENPTSQFIISFASADNLTSHTARINCVNKSILNSMAKQFRIENIKEIDNLLMKYRLALDNDELDLYNASKARQYL